MKAVILDYGTGNLHSIAKALRHSGADVVLESDSGRALRGDVLVLPGVGAFTTAAERLGGARASIATALRDGHPCLAICLGMQLLLDRSEEGPGAGLGVIAGAAQRLTTSKVPHMGWNTLDDVSEPLCATAALNTVYYANSFICRPTTADVIRAWTTHEHERLPAIVRFANTVGVQFHPEKSSRPGLGFIAAFLREVAA
ncbi:MAG: imidazole glycerol phosphate synthase subunit HisH [Gemmatimonadaceae bacterium]